MGKESSSSLEKGTLYPAGGSCEMVVVLASPQVRVKERDQERRYMWKGAARGLAQEGRGGNVGTWEGQREGAHLCVQLQQ